MEEENKIILPAWSEKAWFVECPKCQECHELGFGVVWSGELEMVCDRCKTVFYTIQGE